MSQALSLEILNRLEQTLRRVSARAIEESEPGMLVENVQRMTATVFGTLPAETLLWWSSRTFAGDWLLPDARYLRLGEALYWYGEQRRWARDHGVSSQSPQLMVDDWWHPRWLPLFLIDGGMFYAIDVAASDGTSAPILRMTRSRLAASSST
ncbi:MAG: hypothetical protein AVDCRST_MAG67-1579 [uncultured Solirubrobacteraceae bacterium]|uniref:Knr4/Smi1-like domain-containing protein n=1 Tax=uncultured Solirubrobacteraceae bacterium TaxID=1162706 RepID=A0A6J4SET8_9ACTN|nr:MAG: hypothetical protein AVDCRST_MAG67-1579 [uncultured Solirubrobacteraceae bacterium]